VIKTVFAVVEIVCGCKDLYHSDYKINMNIKKYLIIASCLLLTATYASGQNIKQDLERKKQQAIEREQSIKAEAERQKRLQAEREEEERRAEESRVRMAQQAEAKENFLKKAKSENLQAYYTFEGKKSYDELQEKTYFSANEIKLIEDAPSGKGKALLLDGQLSTEAFDNAVHRTYTVSFWLKDFGVGNIASSGGLNFLCSESGYFKLGNDIILGDATALMYDHWHLITFAVWYLGEKGLNNHIYQCNFYVDGKLQYSSDVKGIGTNASWKFNPPRNNLMKIDNIRIYRRLLSAEGVTKIYEEEKSGNIATETDNTVNTQNAKQEKFQEARRKEQEERRKEQERIEAEKQEQYNASIEKLGAFFSFDSESDYPGGKLQGRDGSKFKGKPVFIDDTPDGKGKSVLMNQKTSLYIKNWNTHTKKIPVTLSVWVKIPDNNTNPQYFRDEYYWSELANKMMPVCNDNQWHWLCIVSDLTRASIGDASSYNIVNGGTCTFYLDGKLIQHILLSKRQINKGHNSNMDFAIGNKNGSMIIDNLRLGYNVLSASEIAAIYEKENNR
jgi:hypothetical protein